MNKRRDYDERRHHARAYLQNIVVGVLNSEEPYIIGSITNIALGGVKCTYNELITAPQKRPFPSIDLISESHYLFDIPCEEVWDSIVETESDSKITNLRQCGFQFGELTPNQVFLLRSFIYHCASLGINSITSNVHIAIS